MNTMHPYLRCISSGASSSNHGVGFPDGSVRPSVVVDFRQTVTLTPMNGGITFALISSPHGSLALRTGSYSGMLPKLTSDGAYGITWAQRTHSYNASTYYVMPHAEIAAATPSAMHISPFGPYGVIAYRSLVNVADVYFTGSTMANGGIVRVFKTNVACADSISVAGRDGFPINESRVTDLDAGIGVAAASSTLPARSSFTVRSVNQKPEYVDVWDRKYSNELSAYCTNAAATTVLSDACWSGFDESMPVNVVSYTGMDASASITIEIRTCLEMVLAPGVLPGIVKPSPVADLGLWQKVANYARAVPTTTVVKAAGKAAMGYVSGGLTGALAALAM